VRHYHRVGSIPVYVRVAVPDIDRKIDRHTEQQSSCWSRSVSVPIEPNSQQSSGRSSNWFAPTPNERNLKELLYAKAW
jgi:hypothetical protein